MSTLKTTNLQESNASGANIVLGTGSGGGATISGVTTATTLRATTGIVTAFSGDITIDDKIVHAGDTNTALRFPSADTFTVETAGSERLRIDQYGKVYHQPSGNGSFEVKWTDINSNGPYAKFWNTDSAYGGGVQVKNNNALGGVEFLNASGSGVAAFYNSTGGWHWGGNLILDSGGIGFNDNAVANHLDDYEEGTFTPVFNGSNGGGTSRSGTGKFTKVGNVVNCWVDLGNADGSSFAGGYIKVTGLPFTASSESWTSNMWLYNVAFDTARIPIFYIPGGGAYANGYYSRDDDTWQPWYVAEWDATQIYARFQLTYLT